MTSTTTSDDKLDSAKRRISALLDRADHPNTSEHEAAACREKAEQLMQTYRIERAMLHLKKHDKRRFETKRFSTHDVNFTLFYDAFEHTKCYVAQEYMTCVVIGYPEDIFYGSILYDRAQKELKGTLEPLWNHEESVQSNIYRLRRSGKGWRTVIALIPYQDRIDNDIDFLSQRSYHKVRYLFQKEENRRGEPRFTWRKSEAEFHRWFTNGFTSRFRQRLDDLRQRAEAQLTEGEYAVALLNDDEALREEFYRLFPEYRPPSTEERVRRNEERRRKRQEEEEQERRRRENLTEAQRRREDDKEERDRIRREKDYERWKRDNQPDPQAWAAGVSSAEKVRLRLDDEVKNTRQSLHSS